MIQPSILRTAAAPVDVRVSEAELPLPLLLAVLSRAVLGDSSRVSRSISAVSAIVESSGGIGESRVVVIVDKCDGAVRCVVESVGAGTFGWRSWAGFAGFAPFHSESHALEDIC